MRRDIGCCLNLSINAAIDMGRDSEMGRKGSGNEVPGGRRKSVNDVRKRQEEIERREEEIERIQVKQKLIGRELF